MKPDHWVKVFLFLGGIIVGGGATLWEINKSLTELRVEVAELRAAILSTASHVVPTGPPQPEEP